MTITNTDLNELLDAIRAGGDIDVVRGGVELMLQALIDAEATARIGAERFERTASRTTQRNGTRDRLLSTKAGDVDLKISKLREATRRDVIPEAYTTYVDVNHGKMLIDRNGEKIGRLQDVYVTVTSRLMYLTSQL